MTITAKAWAARVAPLLGEEWTARPGHQLGGYDAFLHGPRGEEIQVLLYGDRAASAASRVGLTGFLPAELKACDVDPMGVVITLSLARPPEAAAKEITRRMLPGMREILDNRRTAKAARDKHAAELAEFLDEITAILGGDTLQHPTDRMEIGGYLGTDAAHGQVICRAGGLVELEVTLTRAQTAQFVRVLATHTWQATAGGTEHPRCDLPGTRADIHG